MEEIWTEIDSQLNANKEPIEGMTASYSFDLSGEDGGMYGLKFTDGEAEIFPQRSRRCRLCVEDERC